MIEGEFKAKLLALPQFCKLPCSKGGYVRKFFFGANLETIPILGANPIKGLP